MPCAHVVSNNALYFLSFDLLILREVIQRISGVEILDDVTDDQLLAMTGGELLKQEASYFGQVRNAKKPSSRLKESLVSQELAFTLCIQMSQVRDQLAYGDEHERYFASRKKPHLKLVGRLYDQVCFGDFFLCFFCC